MSGAAGDGTSFGGVSTALVSGSTAGGGTLTCGGGPDDSASGQTHHATPARPATARTPAAARPAMSTVFVRGRATRGPPAFTGGGVLAATTVESGAPVMAAALPRRTVEGALGPEPPR